MPLIRQARPSLSTVLPLQQVQFTADHFKEPGVPFVNTYLSQIQAQLNILMGASGRPVIPSGVDVAGQTVSGIGEPSAPSDAVSQGHVSQNYVSKAAAQQSDTIAASSLSNITVLQVTTSQQGETLAQIQAALAAGVSGTITLAKLTGGGTEGSITVTGGIVTGFVQPT